MIEAKVPTKGSWQRMDWKPQSLPNVTVWVNPLGITVMSEVCLTEERKQEWHISISEFGRKPSPYAVAHVRESFGANDFEEDNHGATRIVSLWKPVVKDLEGECDCKQEGEPNGQEDQETRDQAGQSEDEA